ncbi:MAG TPA: hypothetical protein VFC94_05510 [Bacteroidaceae bacterium]|nr:hypothetical protein [Bacteroidaceae bacterium]
MRLLLLLTICLIFSLFISAQKLEWNVSLYELFDNREYKGDMMPQTIYGARISPEIGISVDSTILMIGNSWISEFGTSEKKDAEITLYLKHKKNRITGIFGVFPRRDLNIQLPDVFLYDSIAFFSPNIMGTLLQYTGERFFSDLYCNWFSRQSATDREAFRIVSDGVYKNKNISTGWFMALTHYAGTFAGESIYEKFMFNPYLELNLASFLFLNDINIRGGALISNIRYRANNRWYSPMGFLGHIHGKWKCLDINSLFYAGDKQQKYLESPQAGISFHRGDPFYNHTFYNRTDITLLLAKTEYVDAVFTWSLHFTPNTDIHHQQLIKLNFFINSTQIANKKNKR